MFGHGSVLTEFVAIKVHWFRLSATTSRWKEEKQVVPEEMRRVVRTFKRHHHDWLERGLEHAGKSRPGAASYARK